MSTLNTEFHQELKENPTINTYQELLRKGNNNPADYAIATILTNSEDDFFNFINLMEFIWNDGLDTTQSKEKFCICPHKNIYLNLTYNKKPSSTYFGGVYESFERKEEELDSVSLMLTGNLANKIELETYISSVLTTKGYVVLE